MNINEHLLFNPLFVDVLRFDIPVIHSPLFIGSKKKLKKATRFARCMQIRYVMCPHHSEVHTFLMN